MNVTPFSASPSTRLNAKPALPRVQFGLNPGGLSAEEALNLAKSIAVKEPKENAFVKFFLWIDGFIKKQSSEVVSIIVNAFGTAVVAPVVIAFNKLNDEDTHTKIYSALRQPISAVLTFLTQVGINTPVPGIFDRLGRKGLLGDHYLKPILDIPDNASPDQIQKIERENQEIEKQFKKAMEDPKFLEAAAKFENQRLKEEHDAAVRFAIKGRSTHPPTLKQLLPSEVTLEHSMHYTETRLKRMKGLVGLVLSLITLYPTCMLLNWAYPRIVNTLFPSLIAEDKNPEKAHPIHQTNHP